VPALDFLQDDVPCTCVK